MKELGVLVTDCECLAGDMQKIFDVYWYLGAQNRSVPHRWPASLSTPYNLHTPLSLRLGGVPAEVYLAVSCPQPNLIVSTVNTLGVSQAWAIAL